MISGTAKYKDGSNGSFRFKFWKTLKKMMDQEENLKKVNLFIPIKNIDSEIRTIKKETDSKEEVYFVVEVGYYESLGERGLNNSFFYDEVPTKKEIIQDTKEDLLKDLKEYKNKILSGAEEEFLKILKRIERRLKK